MAGALDKQEIFERLEALIAFELQRVAIARA
jgi:hypothetical protein